MNVKLVKGMLEDISSDEDDSKAKRKIYKHGSAMAIKKASLIQDLKLPTIGRNIKVGS